MCRLLTLLGAGFASPFDDLQLEYPLGSLLLQNRLQLLLDREIRLALRYRLSTMLCFLVSLARGLCMKHDDRWKAAERPYL